jgi:hypothetical protein
LKRQGERYSSGTVVQHEHFWGESVIVWVEISLEAKTDLFILQKQTLKANNYIRDILADYVVPFAPFIGLEFLLMQDKAY